MKRLASVALVLIAIFVFGIYSAVELYATNSHTSYKTVTKFAIQPFKLAPPLTVADHYVCHGPVALGALVVTNPSGDAVQLGSGCTGTIASITVEDNHGDPIHIGAGAHDLTVGSVHLTCNGHDTGKHQDAIQGLGGRNIHFLGGYIGCYSANNSQTLVHTGSAGQEIPSYYTFENIQYDPRGAGAYGLSFGECHHCQFINDQLLTHANRHDCYVGTGSQDVQFVNMSGAAWASHTGTCPEVIGPQPPPTTSTGTTETTTTVGTTTTQTTTTTPEPPPPACVPDGSYTTCEQEIVALKDQVTTLQASLDKANADLANEQAKSAALQAEIDKITAIINAGP